MHKPRAANRQSVPCLLLLALTCLAPPAQVIGAGVTVITHGAFGNVTGWVIPMGDKIAQYPAFPGTNASTYQLSITRNAQGNYVAAAQFLDGVSPLASDSGEIIIALDWSTLAGLSPTTPTTTIANAAAAALLSTNLIADLGGRALAELPLHLIGHSRGASVMAELARFLGAQGVWVDHLTTLDPVPVSGFGDPAMANYVNVLFADNYWQNLGIPFDPQGQSLSGAYNRKLTSLSGGYDSAHSDVHLWYHGTIDLNTPISVDLKLITANERGNWWTATENRGTNTGLLHSLIGGGDRLSNLEPAGAGNGRLSDGFNKVWNLGGGLAANRSALPANNGAWPNLIRFDLTTTNAAAAGGSAPLEFYHQFGSNTLATADAAVFIDADANPYNANETEIFQSPVAGTGTNDVFFTSLSVPLTNVPPGAYRLFMRLNAGARTRYLYAPETLVVTANLQPPFLTDAAVSNGLFGFMIHGSAGQRIVVQASTNLTDWISRATNTLDASTLPYLDPEADLLPQRFYRAVVSP